MDNEKIISKEDFLAGDYTPDDLFPEKEKKESLLDLLEEEPAELIEDLPVESFPVPEGVSKELQQAVKEEPVDSAIYNYKELATRIKSMPLEPKISSGFECIDESLDGGFQGGELVILSAPTKNGKTTMAQTMSYLQAWKGVNSLWFSLEMSWQELTRKFLAMDVDEIVTKEPADLGVYYMVDNRGTSLENLEAKVKEAKEKFGVKIVYIDHLHFLLPLGEVKNISFVVGGIVREVKQIAVRLNITIVLIAHTKKLETDTRPDLNSLRDSSFIAQESDFVFLMWRERIDLEKKQGKYKDIDNGDVYSDKTFLSLEANRRNGKTKRWKFGMINDRFHDYETYLEIFERVSSEKNLDPPEEIKKRIAVDEKIEQEKKNYNQSSIFKKQ